MGDMPEIPDEDHDFTPDLARKIIGLYQTRVAALEAQLAERVKVKPLDWKASPADKSIGEPRTHYGYWVGGYYHVCAHDTRLWSVGTFDNRGQSKHVGFFNLLIEAKAAAQADYARRILSALEATPPAPKVTDWHPMQPLVVSDGGVHRFKSNTCVEALLSHGQKTGFGLNQLACQNHPVEDLMQLAQLIGYSVSGYGDLSYVTDESYDAATRLSEALTAAQEAGKP